MASYTPSYPLTLPTVTGIKTQNWGMERVVAVTESPFTNQEQVFEHEGAQWKATFTLPPMKKDKAAVWLGFLMSLRGRRGTFKIGDQDRKNTLITYVSQELVKIEKVVKEATLVDANFKKVISALIFSLAKQKSGP